MSRMGIGGISSPLLGTSSGIGGILSPEIGGFFELRNWWVFETWKRAWTFYPTQVTRTRGVLKHVSFSSARVTALRVVHQRTSGDFFVSWSLYHLTHSDRVTSC